MAEVCQWQSAGEPPARLQNYLLANHRNGSATQALSINPSPCQSHQQPHPTATQEHNKTAPTLGCVPRLLDGCRLPGSDAAALRQPLDRVLAVQLGLGLGAPHLNHALHRVTVQSHVTPAEWLEKAALSLQCAWPPASQLNKQVHTPLPPAPSPATQRAHPRIDRPHSWDGAPAKIRRQLLVVAGGQLLQVCGLPGGAGIDTRKGEALA